MNALIETMTAADLKAAIGKYFNVTDASIDREGNIWAGVLVSHDKRDACLAWINNREAKL
jgi:hypothetical protein